MVNLITPNIITSQSKPMPDAGIEVNRAKQSTLPTAATGQSQPNTRQTNSTQVQWAKLTSHTPLTTGQKGHLIELNPDLAKILIGQIKGEAVGATHALTPENITLLKQSPLQLLTLLLDNTTLRIVTPANVNTLLNASTTNTQLPIVATQKGWQIASTADLKTALNTTAAQLLKQNLPLQTSTMPLFKMAHILSNSKANLFAHMPKTQVGIQAMARQIIEPTQTKTAQALGQALKNTLKANTSFQQVANIQQNLDKEMILKNHHTALTTSPIVSRLETSLQQLHSVITSHGPSIEKNVFTMLATLQNNIGAIASNQQNLTSMQLSQIHQFDKTLLTLIDSIQKSKLQENIDTIISQQLNTLIKPLNTIVGTLANSLPANNAIMQLLGMSLHNQQIEQQFFKEKVQQQLKNLLGQISAKLQLNQLRHLHLDSTRETPTTIVQQLQGELPLRFNEQVLALTYHIQGFDDQDEPQQSDTKNKDATEKTRRWQLFMSLELTHNETLHCQLSLRGQQINTCFWTESARLCEKTEQRLSDLEKRLNQAGLIVETLQCLAGKPPQDETSLGYHLVDVNT